MQDLEMMQLALEQAKIAFDLGEVPVGAVLLYEGKIIASAYNEVESRKDASAHAEMLCLKRATEVLGNWRLCEATLYCTLEPCVMCAGSMILHRIKQVVWGAKDLRHGAHGSWVDLYQTPHPIHQIEVTRGVLEEEAALLMRQFFRLQRERETWNNCLKK